MNAANPGQTLAFKKTLTIYNEAFSFWAQTTQKSGCILHDTTMTFPSPFTIYHGNQHHGATAKNIVLAVPK